MKYKIKPGISILFVLLLANIVYSQATELEVEYTDDVAINGYLCPVVELFDENGTEITSFNYTINDQLIECFETPDIIGNYSITIKAYPSGEWTGYNISVQTYNYTTHEPNYIESMLNQLWKDINKDVLGILLEEQSEVIGGTEYLVGETGEYSVQILKNNGKPNNDARCKVWIYYPNKTLYIHDNMTHLEGENGINYKSYLIPNQTGVYTVSSICDKNGNWEGNDLLYNAHTFHVAEWATIIQETYNLVKNSVFPSVNGIETNLQNVLDNQSNMWGKLLDIQNDITNNYNEIIETQDFVKDTNATVMVELLNHRNRLIELNRTTTEILQNLTITIIPFLNTLQTDINLIKDYTDTLEEGQLMILANISEVKIEINSFSSSFDSIDNHLNSVENILDCTNVSFTCTLLNSLNSSVTTISENTDSLEQGQASIINYVDTLESTQINMLSYLDILNSELNCSLSLPNNVCFRLALIENHVDSLEETQENISGFVQTINETQNAIENRVNLIVDYTDTLESSVALLSSDIENLNATYKQRFDSIDSDLTTITSLINSINNQGVSLDNQSTALLNNIFNLVQTTNISVHDVKAQLEEAVIAIEEINVTTHNTYSLFLDFNQTLSLVDTNTQSILENWNSYDVEDIITQVNVVKAQLDTIQVNNTELLSYVTQIKSVVDATRTELGFNNKSLTAYEYFVVLDNLLTDVNMSIIEEIRFEHNATREQMLDAIKSNTTALISEINANEQQIYNILAKWGSFTAQNLIDNLTSNREKLSEMQSWLESFNTTEEIRFNEEKSLFNSILAWLGLINQSEKEKHNITTTRINDLLTEIDTTKDLVNEIIAKIGYYNGSNTTTIYGQIESLIYKNLNLTSEITDLVEVNEVNLYKGANLISLPRQPTNISIEIVLADIIDSVEKVEYYNSTSKTWKVFNPKAPFGNSLAAMLVNTPYWITVTEDVKLIIK